MKVRNVIAVSVVAMLLFACIPDLSGVSLSDCIKTCNEDAKYCTTQSDSKIDQCTDVQCIRDAAKDTEWCIFTMMDCVAICIDKIEDKLK
jgi:hypothetical protein